MKKFKILCFVVTALLAFAACSNDGDEITVPRNLDPYEGNSNDEGSTESSGLDASLLPGYWIMVKDGVRQKTGVWFSDGTDPLSYEGAKTVKFFSFSDNKDESAHCLRSCYWFVGENGGIGLRISNEEVTGVTKLTMDKLTIRYYQLIYDREVIEEYERLSEPVKIED
ncbi:MAG: hypothetical protein J5506_08520 [Prevotella sp.]|nr:hypothetical protein [Prevotella sp.]